ncbi:peptidase family C78-domain-containing protein [Panaeolus papilionaceus]|nr:peptidase family C78-domain-containing protein [Panaeolus papilionaceus]
MSDSIKCAFCNCELDFMTLEERESHYEAHFCEDQNVGVSSSAAAGQHSSSRIETGMQSVPKAITWQPRRKWPFPKETDVFWHPGMTDPPPKSCTPGLIPLLKSLLEKSHNKGKTRRAALCIDNAVLYSREPWDAGWGCGYRNFLMACAALMTQDQQPAYRSLLESPSSPSVRNLQRWIEDAWSEGFDPDGKKQLQRLVDTRKWIGTADLWVALTYRRIPSELVDFDLKDKNHHKLIDWIVHYFTPNQSIKSMNAFESLQSSCVTSTHKMPIILQHNGHSRTIVGYEVTNIGSINLLTFDPAYKPAEDLRKEVLSRLSGENAQASTSTVLNGTTMGQTHNSGQKRKRGDENSPQKTGPSKRRVSLWPSDETSVLKAFRIQPFKVGKKNDYQVLYFPMTAPLTETQRLQSKEVRSIKVS